jgi:hypothetical protein
MIKILVIGLLVVVAGVMAYVRFAPTDAAMWHVDPRAISKPAKPNNWMIRPVGGDDRPPNYEAEVPVLVAAIEAAVDQMGDMRLIAGNAQSGHLTYISRTKWMAFPDFTTFRVYSTDGGSSFAAFSRARFGEADMGYNRARLEALLPLIAAEMAARAPT